ncbi:hypothetical protein TIFTF001_042167 [Ficus carica]|uniref:Uncharacterized protein n=2 Tax=Ficus carica TaxID=3494 RepID=A0AA88CX27_FICCA|nr:hypothetical protein TIFTF001_042165 [Ficus carica]GMN35089.1 hypothetical protein TIFTF001_042167 [Ficus carica]
MRREIEELKEMVRGLCANWFAKRICQSLTNTIALRLVALSKKKKPGVSDPPIMPVESQEFKFYIIDELQGGQLLVAIRRARMESLPTDTVHGMPLGEGNV